MDSLASRLPVASVDWPTWFAGALGLGIVTPVASVDGGWAPSSWGWPTLAFAWIALIALFLRTDVTVSRLQIACIGAFGLFALWTVLSAAWSNDAGASVLSFERVLVYVTAVVAVTVALRAELLQPLLVGVWGAATLVAGYALLTRLYPTRFAPPPTIAGNRLAVPVGYWNALGFLCGFGIVLALGLVAYAQRRTLAALAAASMIPLALALYFTFSRGGWASLLAGIWIALALDPTRLSLLLGIALSLPWTALAVLDASRQSALRNVVKQPDVAAASGAQVARTAIVLALLAAASAVALPRVRERIGARRVGGRAIAGAAAAFVVLGIVVASAHYGSPAAAVRAGWRSFNASAPTTSTDLNKRLFSFSSSGRTTQWRVALDDAKAHPLAGSGAGTYQRAWLQHRTTAGQVQNAHNLYLETFAELGVVGLALLLAALCVPLLAIRRARALPFVGVIGGAYAAWLLHNLVDWDWQLPGVSLGPVLLAAGVLLAAPGVEPGRWLRRGTVAVLAALVVVAFVGLEGNRAAGAAAHDQAKGRFDAAIAAAGKAHRWAPWSAHPLQLLGEAELQHGKLTAAAVDFRRALVKAPDDWRIWLDLALAETTPARKRAAALRAERLNPLSPEIDAIRPALGLPKRP